MQSFPFALAYYNLLTRNKCVRAAAGVELVLIKQVDVAYFWITPSISTIVPGARLNFVPPPG